MAILLLILIVALIAYLITSHHYERKFAAVNEQLKSEFQDHMHHKEREHALHVDDLNNKFNKRIEDQIDGFAVKYNQLKDEYENLVKEGRKDAVKRSKQVVSGQVYEQISPLVPNFPYELKDVRHVGSPLDFLVFNGLYDSTKELEIVFFEVKSGVSDLSGNERRVRKAVAAGRVRYEIFRPDVNQNVEKKLEASITPLRPKIVMPGAYALDPGPVDELPVSAALYETLTCGHCKKSFKIPPTPGRKPLFCPTCRGTG